MKLPECPQDCLFDPATDYAVACVNCWVLQTKLYPEPKSVTNKLGTFTAVGEYQGKWLLDDGTMINKP